MYLKNSRIQVLHKIIYSQFSQWHYLALCQI